MNAGRGDLPRLVDDLAAGRLTGGAPPADYLLLLQEAVSNADQPLVATRRLQEFVVPVYRIGNRLRSVAVVSTLPLGDTRALVLPRERQPRMAAVATIATGGVTLFVSSAHLENRLGLMRGLFGDNARRRQAMALVGALPPGPGIAGGDFNTMLGSTEPALRIMAERFGDTPDLLTPTFRGRLPLDHLFFDLPDGWSARTAVIDDRYNSDHHPVLGMLFGPT